MKKRRTILVIMTPILCTAAAVIITHGRAAADITTGASVERPVDATAPADGYIIQRDQDVAKNEPGPHNLGGPSTGYVFFEKVWVQDDFTRIQQINKPLGLMALGKSTLDLRFVTGSATEINKRAERLKENLALPESPDTATAAGQYTGENSTELKTPIVNLARLILDFTSNHFFKEAGVVGADAYQARRDLEAIIEISSTVRDLSKRLSESEATGQSPQDPERDEKRALAALRLQEIPEATLPCSPDEATWWEKLRAVGGKVKKSRDKYGDKFFQLLKEGQDKFYQAPIPNRGPTFLRRFPPKYTEEGRQQKVSGGIAMVVEFLQDGTVGEVKIVQGVGFGMDETAAEAIRKSIFLPAVKGGRFVSMRMPMTMSFTISR